MSLPEFIHDLPDAEVQPLTIRPQGFEFIALIQWDGTGEFQHWVLIDRGNLDDVIKQLEALR
jgi:hypothetical protein